jgi:HD-like signal output (HDOD) protein
MAFIKRDLKHVLEQADDFPALPQNVQRILKLSGDPDVSLKTLADVISTDAAFSLRIVRMVNSSFYGLKSEVKDVHHAVSLLGARIIRDIAFTLSIMDVFPIKRSVLYQRQFERGLATGVCADFIAQLAGQQNDPNIFLAGLLQNLGMFVFIRYLPNSYMEILKEAEIRRLNLTDIEPIYLGLNHIQAGEAIAQRWRLPQSIRLSIAAKEIPLHIIQSVHNPATVLLIKVTYLGGLAADIFYGWNKEARIAHFKNQMQELLDFPAETTEDVLHSIPQLLNDGGFDETIGFQRLPDFKIVLKEAERELLFNEKQYLKTYLELIHLQEDSQKTENTLRIKTKELEQCQSMVSKLVERLRR